MISTSKNKTRRKGMKKEYEMPMATLDIDSSDVIMVSGDGYEDDPWSEGFGGEL